LELLNENEIIEIVKKILDEGAPGGKFIIMPTAAPINEPASLRVIKNYYAFIETALNYGKY